MWLMHGTFFAILLLPCIPRLDAQTSSAEATHLYGPGTNLERSELEMLRTAQHSVDIAMYSFTDRELAEALANLAKNGVVVRVYRDRSEFQHEAQYSGVNTTEILNSAGIEVRVKGARDLMHLKSYCIDHRMVRTGSANWSPTGLKRQDNDVRYEFSAAASQLFELEFGELWERASNLVVRKQ